MQSGTERAVYAVRDVSLIAADADVSAVIGERRGAPTLTLITCGGTFDRSAHAYDHRVIVRAALVLSTPS